MSGIDYDSLFVCEPLPRGEGFTVSSVLNEDDFHCECERLRQNGSLDHLIDKFYAEIEARTGVRPPVCISGDCAKE